MCISSIENVDDVEPLAQLLGIPLLVVLPGCSGIVSSSRLRELRKSGPVAFEALLMRKYAEFRTTATRFLPSTRTMLGQTPSQLKDSCKGGVYLFSDGILPRESPKAFLLSSASLSTHAHRFAQSVGLNSRDHMFCCLFSGHPGAVIDAAQVCRIISC